MKPKNQLKLPHLFLFKDLSYSFLESKKILSDLDTKKSISNDRIEKLAKHYLIVYEVLDFLHEYTPDFILITKIYDREEELICFANAEFSEKLGLKHIPEGSNILDVLPETQKTAFQDFIHTSLEKIKKENPINTEILTNSPRHEIVVGKDNKKLYELSLRISGIVKEKYADKYFEGYSILLGRDVTTNAIKAQMAESFTNIPLQLNKTFEKEAFSRRVLKREAEQIQINNVKSISGYSDISGSSSMKLEAEEKDKISKSHKNIQAYNKKINEINQFLSRKWQAARKKFDAKLAFLFEETDGIDYNILILNQDSSSQMKKIRKIEFEIMADICIEAAKRKYPLKHLIVVHNQGENFYYEEELEHRFKVSSESAGIFVKKKRMERAKEEKSGVRVLKDGYLTVITETKEEINEYEKLFSTLLKNDKINKIHSGKTEKLPGLKTTYFIQAKLI